MTLEFLKKPTLIEWTHTIYAYNGVAFGLDPICVYPFIFNFAVTCSVVSLLLETGWLVPHFS